MGIIIAKDCVNMADLSAEVIHGYETTDFTVMKSDGSFESGWRLSRTPHRCIHNREGWQAAHACFIEDEWRVFLFHNTFPELDTHTPLELHHYNKVHQEHTCGWRRIGTFWPTKLTEDDDYGTWTDTLVQHLTDLQSRKLSEDSVCSSPLSAYSPLPQPH